MRLTDYIKDTRSEIKHVVWPSRKLAITYTVIVIVASIVVAAFLGVFDFLFSSALKSLIS